MTKSKGSSVFNNSNFQNEQESKQKTIVVVDGCIIDNNIKLVFINDSCYVIRTAAAYKNPMK